MARQFYNKDGTEVIVVSDTHVGRKTPTFNTEVLEKRVRKFLDGVADTRHFVWKRHIRLKHRVLVLLGDMVDGECVYPSQPYEQELNVNEQIEVFTELFEPLLVKADTVVCVPGNHGRSRKEGTGNWDLMLYYVLRERFGSRSRFYVSLRNKYRAVIDGVRFYMSHPWHVRMYQNIPMYGITQDVLREHSIELFDVALFGHFHVLYKYVLNDVLIYGNGTMLTDDEYTVRKGLKPTPAFWYLLLLEGRVIFDRAVFFGGVWG